MVTEKAVGQTDGNTTFLRAARSGNMEKVLEFINANVDINTANSNGLNALHLASKDGHTEVVSELLKRGANVDAATKKGNTALHIASLAGQEEVVKLLIEHGASVNVQSQSGFTPLYMAAQENHDKVVRYLLNHGANQSLATEDGFTPLAVAMQQGHNKVVTELLENDTKGKIRLPALHIAAKKDDCKAAALLLQSEHNPDITSKSGFTPLHIASHYGNDSIASLLLAKGADVNYTAKHNITPLHVAAKWGRNNMVILILDKGGSIIAKTRDGLTPLHCAARSGHEQVVDILLQKHAPITAKTKNGLAPLHMASQGDHVEAARVLLSHRAPVDDVTVDYLTALHVASHCGHVSVAKLLLDRKADPNARALNGFTPLHIACKKNRMKIVELLLKHGASIEATTESGLSPLHVASFMGCMNIVIYLLQCGANPDVATLRGETPLHLAARANQTDIIRILLRNGAQVDAKAKVCEQQTPLHIAARMGNTDIVMLLLQHGADVDSVTKDSYTSLHISAKEGREEVAQTLIDNGASITAVTKKGFTPLHLSAKYGHPKLVTLFLQRGAPIDAQGKNGVTPLHVASHYSHQIIALLLLDKGASPHSEAKRGHTPLHIAAKKNQMDLAAMLLEYGANPEVESKLGFTPLHLAAMEGHTDITNLLVEQKADVNHCSSNGLTPLHVCAQEDCIEVAKALIKNGANVNAVTRAGYTPLHVASHFGQLNMVRLLLSHNVKVDVLTFTGYTPLHQAAQQGNSAIVALLLDNGASPDSKNHQGQTALYIAQKLGYISVVEVLKNITESGKGVMSSTSDNEDKYKVVIPETIQENFMSDSEEEGGEDVTNEQSYRYLTVDEMKSLGDDSMPLDIIKEDRYDTTAGIDESFSPLHINYQSNAVSIPDNVDVSRTPVIQSGRLKWRSFLVSFLVDAKGGAMRGCRHSGVRVIIPPQCVAMPTRVTCRYVRRDKIHPPPPPLMEGEALASRILELGPVSVKFLSPVVIEVPNFAALRGNEREIVILRSDNGETWREHTLDSSVEAVHEILTRNFEKESRLQTDESGRITSIVTTDFPHYFAIVSRIRQEVHAIGPDGGMVSSTVVPQVQAVFPQGALTKKIKVGLQAQPIPSELTAAVLGNCVAVSPIVTIEPRRRKFHKPITLTLPVPQAANKGMINQYSGDAPTLRLLCSITGGTSRAQWEDVTGSTQLTFVKECVSFTTTVSARFWLLDIRDIAMATKKALELYREAILTPFMAKFVVFAKRIDSNEARLRVFCMTDDKEDKTLECQEHFTEVAKSRDVEVLEGKKQLVELSGNLISVTKSGDQLELGFSAFHENRLPFTVRVKDGLADPIGRMLFFKEQKSIKTSTLHSPICVLNIVLPDGMAGDHEFLDSPSSKYSFLNDTQGYHRSELRFPDISNLIGEDWILLADRLGISQTDVNVIQAEYPKSVAQQALTMLRIWHQQAGYKASPNILENALLGINRKDIVQECIISTNHQMRKRNQDVSDTYSKEIADQIIEDYHPDRKDSYSTDDDEKKYTAEEKEINDHETKISVSERKMEIEKRLQDKSSRKFSKERTESEEIRQFFDQDSKVMKRPNSEQIDFVKNVAYDELEGLEPTSLTFEQKRLSFERGVSVEKIVSEMNIESEHSAENVTREKSMKDRPEIEVKPISSIIERKIETNTSEKLMSLAEKRSSFEESKLSEVKDKDKKEDVNRSAKDGRRDSELMEGISVRLDKLKVERTSLNESLLSPKPIATPPSSPSEFQKQNANENGSTKSTITSGTDEDTKDVSKGQKYNEFSSVGLTQQRGYTERKPCQTEFIDNNDTNEANKDDSMDYISMRKFWQSFESAGSAIKTAPVSRPRTSVNTSGACKDKLVIKSSCTENRKEKVMKSESEDNVTFTSSIARQSTKSTIRQMHSLTLCSTDSEAEYIAICGVESLAYENVAFSEEREPQLQPDGGVKAKKMIFEQLHKDAYAADLQDPIPSPSLKTTEVDETNIPKFEEHLDKSEVEPTEKRISHTEDYEEPSTATPIDIHSTNEFSDDGVDSTQSESDITPEDLKDKQYSVSDLELVSSNTHKFADSDHSVIGQLDINIELSKANDVIPDISPPKTNVEFCNKVIDGLKSKESTIDGPCIADNIITISKTKSIESKIPVSEDHSNFSEIVGDGMKKPESVSSKTIDECKLEYTEKISPPRVNSKSNDELEFITSDTEIETKVATRAIKVCKISSLKSPPVSTKYNVVQLDAEALISNEQLCVGKKKIESRIPVFRSSISNKKTPSEHETSQSYEGVNQPETLPSILDYKEIALDIPEVQPEKQLSLCANKGLQLSKDDHFEEVKEKSCFAEPKSENVLENDEFVTPVDGSLGEDSVLKQSTTFAVDSVSINSTAKMKKMSVQLDEIFREIDDISDKQILTYNFSDKQTSISEIEAQIVAETLVNEIEMEICKRPDIVQNLLLLQNSSLLQSLCVEPPDDNSNDITDEDLRSTGTELDTPLVEHQCYDDRIEMNINTESTMSHSIFLEDNKMKFEHDEFNVLECVDFENRLIAEKADSNVMKVDKPQQKLMYAIDKGFPLPSTKSSILEVHKLQQEKIHKGGDESHSLQELMSPDSNSSDIETKKGDGYLKSVVEIEPHSSSSDSHYQSLATGNCTASSRPCSSDVEVLLSCGVISAAGGFSEYETAVSQSVTTSHEFHTAVSSASLHESLKSIDSESSGHLGSAEISSDISETLVPSTSELDHDTDIIGVTTEGNFDGEYGMYSRLPKEPYDQEIPINVIRQVSMTDAIFSASHDKSKDIMPDKLTAIICDDKVLYSCDDSSSMNTTEGENVQTAFEVVDIESERMVSSLMTEQCLTTSAISNQLSLSMNSVFKDGVNLGGQMINTSAGICTSSKDAIPDINLQNCVTIFTSSSKSENQSNMNTQITSCVDKYLPNMSLVSDSFEIVEKPDSLEEFVAAEETTEKPLKQSIESGKYTSNSHFGSHHEVEIKIPTITTITLKEMKCDWKVDTTEDSCTFESLTFGNERQPMQVRDSSPTNEMYENKIEEGKNWIEMQFQADSDAAEYEYEYERVPLEDIKEEDTDEMQSSKVGSAASQISQSISSLSSLKQSLSSTPDHGIPVDKGKIGNKLVEPDAVSQSSLQEFERFEQMMALESMKSKLSGSQDSLASSTNSKKRANGGDNISLSSLNEFEGLEQVCVEAERIEERVKAEERSLSQIEEGHESQASGSESCETLEKSVYDESDNGDDYEQKMFEIDEIIRQAQTNVEQFTDLDPLERTESFVRGDSFEETSHVPDFEMDQPPAKGSYTQSEIYSGKKYIETIDLLSQSLTTSTDSWESKVAKHLEDRVPSTTDSLERKEDEVLFSDFLDDEEKHQPANIESASRCIREKVGDFVAIGEECLRGSHFSPHPIGSPDSMDMTGSTVTYATYHNEGDSVMSSSFTSVGSNTMMSSAENVENIVTNYSNWLDSNRTHITEIVDTVIEDKNYSNIAHTIELPSSDGTSKLISSIDLKTKLPLGGKDAAFQPGEHCSETRTYDAQDNLQIQRVVETRAVISLEKTESIQTFTLSNYNASNPVSDGVKMMLQSSNDQAQCSDTSEDDINHRQNEKRNDSELLSKNSAVLDTEKEGSHND